MWDELRAALRAESLKALRSRLPWVTVGAITLAALVSAFFMFVLQNPERARSMGLLGDKAQLGSATADWAGYLSLAAQVVAVGGLIVFGIIDIWLFGREFAEHTAKDLLALPTSRTAIVVAKHVVGLVWCLALTVLLLGLVLALGAALGLPGWSGRTALTGAGVLLLAGALTSALVSVYGLAASAGRGYLPAVGVLFLTVLVAQVVAVIGYGAWFPWSVPSLIAGAGGPEQPQPGAVGVLMVVVVAVGAGGATAVWWERADQGAQA
ncbi:MAG TPA: ABC transporter permease [Pedococcus sp.]|jgi:ABC-2 type transport system permease protein|uniref:ABC transporter permease n=1 Tax=Pedococcus sp. TaxID=2860345 RepID=UPI002F925586